MTEAQAAAFIQSHTVLAQAPLVPELTLHLATEMTPIWEASEDLLRQHGIEPPYWAFAWPGSQALARHVLDNPRLVAGKRVLDFASGCGLAALAAAQAGAAGAVAVDIDPMAAVAARLNADLNGLSVEAWARDLTGEGAPLPEADVVLTGDICYSRGTSERVLAWLRRMGAAGASVLMADPGRAFVPSERVREVAVVPIPVSPDLEGKALRETRLLWILP